MARVTVGYGLLIVVCIFLATLAWAARVCPECGAANPDENNFCEACGSPLKPMVTCPECGEKYPEGTVSCTCGHAFLKPKTVTVTVTPAKATIYVNGVARGKGKAEVTLAPGEAARLEGRLKGYDAVTRNIGYDAAAPAIRLTLTKATTTKPTLPGVPRRESFWDSDVLLWGTVGLAAACFGYGYYNDREAAEAARSGNESTDPGEIEFYRNEVAKYERRRNASYIAGGGVAGGAAYFGARRVFLAVNITAFEARLGIGIGF